MLAIDVPPETIPADLDLTEVDGNAFAIIGAVRRQLKRAGNPPEVVESFTAQAQADDYDHLLRVAMAFVR